MTRSRPLLAAGITAALCASFAPAATQGIARSQQGSVRQSVAGTEIEIVYRRPVARGRELFGALVPWGRIWSPSADSAARLSVSRAVEVNGRPLPAGSYGLWAVPDSAAWTLVFSRVASAFHLSYPEGRDALRVRAVPQRGEHVETLQLAFPLVDADSAVLQLRWGTTVVPLTIRARPGGTR